MQENKKNNSKKKKKYNPPEITTEKAFDNDIFAATMTEAEACEFDCSG